MTIFKNWWSLGFITLATMTPSQAVRLLDVTLAPHSDPSSLEESTIVQFTFHMENDSEEEQDYGKITTLKGDVRVLDTNGYLTMRLVTRLFQEEGEAQFQKQNSLNSKSFFSNFANQPIAHWQNIFSPLLQKALRKNYQTIQSANGEFSNFSNLNTRHIRSIARDYTELYYPQQLSSEIIAFFGNDGDLTHALSRGTDLEKRYTGMGHMADLADHSLKETEILAFSPSLHANTLECLGLSSTELSREKIMQALGSHPKVNYEDQYVLKEAQLEDLALAYGLLFGIKKEITYGQYFKIMGNFLTLTSTIHTYDTNIISSDDSYPNTISPRLVGLCTYGPHKLKKTIDPDFKSDPTLSFHGECLLSQLAEIMKQEKYQKGEDISFIKTLEGDYPKFTPLFQIMKEQL